MGIRSDAKWNVPEPELVLVMNSRGRIVGYTIGNDMSSRDIEGENLLYLPQTKTYHRSCALGPWIILGLPKGQRATGTSRWKSGGTASALLRANLLSARSNAASRNWPGICIVAGFPHGAVLLTGTGIVPSESFTLAERDEIRITISGIGGLTNPVTVV